MKDHNNENQANDLNYNNYKFIHNPKTGGETIETLLNINKNHNFIYKRKEEIKNKYSFVFVRHPVSRIISWYNHLLKPKYWKEILSNELNDKSSCYMLLKKGVNLKNSPSFQKVALKNNINDWIKIIMNDIDKYYINEPHTSPLSLQYLYVYDKDSRTQLVSDVFRFENYEEELIRLLKKIKKENLIKKIDKTNHSIKKNNKLNEESLKLIYNYFKKDFELFNYKLYEF